MNGFELADGSFCVPRSDARAGQVLLEHASQLAVDVSTVDRLLYIAPGACITVDAAVVQAPDDVGVMAVIVMPRAQLTWIAHGAQRVAVALVTMHWHLAEYSHVRMYVISQGDEYYLMQRFTLAQQAELRSFYDFSCSTIVRASIRYVLAGSRACVEVTAMYRADGESQYTIDTVQEHSVGNTFSCVVVKGIGYDRSRVAYTGLIAVCEGAAQTRAVQKNYNIICSSEASVRSEPQLAVAEHAVQCTHASATGFLDFEQLFYLQSRGITIQKAKDLLIYGFFADMIKSIENKEVKEQVVLRYCGDTNISSTV